MRRWLIRITILVVFLGVIGYGAAGTVVYQRTVQVDESCFDAPRESWAANFPDDFHTGGKYGIRDVDTTPYLMPDYETVAFPSRDGQVTIRAWYVPAETADAPAVILVHGLDGCRHSPIVLLPAGMLHRAGFQTLLIDLRNHGESDRITGHMSGGLLEYNDVLGAWDWLVQSKQVPPQRIGLFGASLGAATVLITGGEEPQVAAVWEDSGYADAALAIDGELNRLHYPAFLGPAGVFMGRLIDGVDITARTPRMAAAKLGSRPVFITHSEADTRMPVIHAMILADALHAAGNPVDPWIVSGSIHAQAMFDYLDEYESRLLAFFSDSLK